MPILWSHHICRCHVPSKVLDTSANCNPDYSWFNHKAWILPTTRHKWRPFGQKSHWKSTSLIFITAVLLLPISPQPPDAHCSLLPLGFLVLGLCRPQSAEDGCGLEAFGPPAHTSPSPGDATARKHRVFPALYEGGHWHHEAPSPYFPAAPALRPLSSPIWPITLQHGIAWVIRLSTLQHGKLQNQHVLLFWHVIPSTSLSS